MSQCEGREPPGVSVNRRDVLRGGGAAVAGRAAPGERPAAAGLRASVSV